MNDTAFNDLINDLATQLDLDQLMILAQWASDAASEKLRTLPKPVEGADTIL